MASRETFKASDLLTALGIDSPTSDESSGAQAICQAARPEDTLDELCNVWREATADAAGEP